MTPISLSEFTDKVNEVMPQIAKEFIQRQGCALNKTKISLPQFLTLKFLHHQGECNMSLLAHFMNVTTAAMTGLVERLVRDGYVVRLPDQNDRRIIKIKLTSKGSELIRKTNEQRRQTMLKIFSRISQFERRDCLNTLLHIHDVLAEEKENSRQ